MSVTFSPTVHDALIPAQVRANAKKGVPVIGPPGLCEGRSLAICGAGPSLVQPEGYDEVWACNRAVHHVEATHGVCIDPSPVMSDVWASPPEAVYFLASVVSPDLVDHLLGFGRRVAFFHSLQTTRQEPETELYGRLYARTCLAHSGMNVAARAVDLGLWLGYRRITLYGCDMAFGEDRQMYADGARYDGDWWLTTEIDGRRWRTKGDMLHSAITLVRLRRAHPAIHFAGDTLLRALQGQPDTVLDREWQTEERAA